MLASEGARDGLCNDMTNALPSAGISSRGYIRRMSRAMLDSVAQHDFYGNCRMHYMGNRALSNTPQDAEEEFIHSHDSHMELQERMLHPIAFQA